jgi:outer membrane protein OmpA-like peptidoglycan-associated protein
MFDEEDRETGFALFLVIALAITVSIFTLGIAAGTAIGGSTGKAASAQGAAAATRLYFDLDKADVPADASAALAPFVAGAKQGRRVTISGFHDASGDAAANEELAKQRAFAVRDALVAAGAPADRIDLAKPALMTGGEDPREARRVEVTLQ